MILDPNTVFIFVLDPFGRSEGPRPPFHVFQILLRICIRSDSAARVT